MKKNKLMRLASGLLVLTLISTCAISGTYAKYVTEGRASDTARVANFGVVVNAGGTLYSNKYEYSVNTPTTLAAGTSSGATVVTMNSGEDNVVAPGTKSADGLSFGVSGTPEVAVKVAADITAEDIYLGTGYWAVMAQVSNVTAENFGDFTGGLYKLENSSYSSISSYGEGGYSGDYYQITDSATVASNYYPVVYTLTGSTGYAGSVSAASAQAVADALADAIAGTDVTGTTTGSYAVTFDSAVATGSYIANTNLASAGPQLGDLKLTWEWDFDASTAGTYDAQDTILGDLIAQKNGTMTDGIVVYSSDSGVSYTAVTIGTGTDYTVSTTASGIVAYLNTSFGIELTVTQID